MIAMSSLKTRKSRCHDEGVLPNAGPPSLLFSASSKQPAGQHEMSLHIPDLGRSAIAREMEVREILPLQVMWAADGSSPRLSPNYQIKARPGLFFFFFFLLVL